MKKLNKGKLTKFKLRTRRMLITYKTEDSKAVSRILQNLPAGLTKIELGKKDPKKKAKK